MGEKERWGEKEGEEGKKEGGWAESGERQRWDLYSSVHILKGVSLCICP